MPVSETPRRIDGYDLARALAVFGMILVNFDSIAGQVSDDPSWLRCFIDWIEGRAAVTFVVLAGIGISLKTKSVRRCNDSSLIRGLRFSLLKRGLVLFLTGILFSLVWLADILHFYGVFMVIGAALLTAPQRRLLIAVLISIIVSASWLTLFDVDQGVYNWLMPDQDNPWSPQGMILDLFFSGYYAVVPWTAFLVLGMWIGRLDISRPAVRSTLMAAGIILYLTAETVAERLAIWVLNRSVDTYLDIALWWLSIDTWTPLPVFVASGAGSAVMVIVVCIWASEKLKQSRLHDALLDTGRMSLTVYVAHILIGLGLNHLCPGDEDRALAVVTATAVAVFAFVFSTIETAQGIIEALGSITPFLQFRDGKTAAALNAVFHDV